LQLAHIRRCPAMSTPPNQARVAGILRDLAMPSPAASVANDILGKGFQCTESFTQETQDKQESRETQNIQEPQDSQAAQERQETKEVHVLHDRKALTEKESVDEDAEVAIEATIICSRLFGVETFLSYGF